MDAKITDPIKQRYEELQTQLSDSAVTGDPAKLKTLAQEYSQVEHQYNLIIELEKTEQRLAEAEGTLASESDEDLLSIAQEDVEGLRVLQQRLEGELREAVRPKDPKDARNAIIEIRAGTGGDEAALFAASLYRMYSRYAQNHGWKNSILSSSQSDIGGFKEMILEVTGTGAFGDLKFESGVHRVQRVPETEKAGRVHTSAATVAVLPEAEEAEIVFAPNDLRIDVFRAGGHGGQSVNTTDSAVRIIHLPTGIMVSCQDEKSQHQNKAKAMQILRARLLAAEQERLHKERGDMRKSQIGSGDRSEKIRTYNFPQDRITDHRIKLTLHNIATVMDGQLEPLIEALKQAEQDEA
jgi:peptide chain release factor 1